jgi:hypothetical protein
MKNALLLGILLLAGCASDPAFRPTVDEATASGGDDKADGSDELRVRAADSTVWVRHDLERRDDAFVLRGRASRNLVDGRAFVFDDVYGAFLRKSARTFEVSWQTSEIASLLQGVPLFVGLSLAPGRAVTARVVVRPRLTGLTGRYVYFSPELTPVVSGGRVVYRLTGTTKSAIKTLSVEAGGVQIPDVVRIDDTHFRADLLPDHVLALTAGARLSVHAVLAGGRTSRSANVALSVARIGLTDGDAYEVWPPAVCADETAACLRALPPGAADLGSCGEAVDVLPCLGTTGVTVTDVDLPAALAAVDRRLDAAFRADAQGLVGAARVEAFVEGTRLSAESRLEQQIGRRYPDAAARDAALAAEIEAALDAAYARPLDLVEPLAPIPGDAARTRDVVADALLAHLASLDLRASEWGRPLEELTHDYRAQHVASIRFFREQAVPEGNVYIGSWLGAGAYIEITVDPATGAVTNLLFEVD